MKTSDFDFHLPDDRIALHPVVPRDAARLLVVRPDATPTLEDRVVRELPALLQAGDVLVVNDTRVIPAALTGFRVRGTSQSRVHANLVRRVAADSWQAFVRPAKRLAVGDEVRFGGADTAAAEPGLVATLEDKANGGLVTLSFNQAGDALDAAVAACGAMPLPPYIANRRPATDADNRDYQTVFAERDGAVAAPTAALHFTPSLLAALEQRRIRRVAVTLHVGAGTFLPVKADAIADHHMHAEWGELTAETAAQLNAARQAGGRIVAVGTTALRLLETAADANGTIHPFSGETDIFIRPGHRFRGVDVLMTNFHLPRSTLFMLVAAFSGLDMMRNAYAHAISVGYRFYSYGDSSLLFPAHELNGDLAGDLT
ncbi:MAG: tRNA preQ1(34) S-adenosylmethionine ribosyltransferase-isomerase QueA [Pseudomonadota bacterium]